MSPLVHDPVQNPVTDAEEKRENVVTHQLDRAPRFVVELFGEVCGWEHESPEADRDDHVPPEDGGPQPAAHFPPHEGAVIVRVTLAGVNVAQNHNSVNEGCQVLAPNCEVLNL